MTWTQFRDMHSGGDTKCLPYENIFIQAPEKEAVSVFYSRFKRSPKRVTCTCCGQDFSILEYPSLKQATGFERNCTPLETPRDPITGRFNNDDPILIANYYLDPGEEPPVGYSLAGGWPYSSYRLGRQWQSLEEYIIRPDVFVLTADDISEHERHLHVPEEGYVWQG